MRRVPWTRQPPYPVGIDRANPLTGGIAALFVGGDGFEQVNKVQFLKSGSPVNTLCNSGKCVRTATAGGSYDGWYAPNTAQNSRIEKLYDPIAPPVTLFIVGSAKSATNNGAGLVRANGSGTPSFSIAFWDGTFRGASTAVRTSGGSIAITTPTPQTPNSSVGGTHVAVVVIGKTTTTVYCDNFQKDSFSTPSGNFYYEYSDQYRCLSFGGAYIKAGGDLSMAGAVYGKEWSESQVRSFIKNPWQIFEPYTVFDNIPFPIVTAQFARPTSDASTGTWTASSGTLASCLDETTASDADYITTTNTSTCEVALGSVTDPSVSTGHIVRYRISATSGGITVRLRQGTTTIATWTHATAPTSLTTYSQTLTGGEADSITDYTALRLQFEAT